MEIVLMYIILIGSEVGNIIIDGVSKSWKCAPAYITQISEAQLSPHTIMPDVCSKRAIYLMRRANDYSKDHSTACMVHNADWVKS
jgi:hypothetical protein